MIFVLLCEGKSTRSSFSSLVPGPFERSKMKIHDHISHLTSTLTISTHQLYPEQHFISHWRAGTKIDGEDQMPPSAVVARPWHTRTWGLGTWEARGVLCHRRAQTLEGGVRAGIRLRCGRYQPRAPNIQQWRQIIFNVILWKQSKLMPAPQSRMSKISKR